VTAKSRRDNAKGKSPAFTQSPVAITAPLPDEHITITARTPNQKRYMRLLASDQDILFATGPAGTGKTYLATLDAINRFRSGEVEKIIITRPNVDAGDPLGFLPGTKDKKMEPWMMPIIDVFKEVYSPAQFARLQELEKVVIEPLTFMRGRTFKNAAILGDEMQNTTPEQMVMFLTRIGEGSYIVCSGDLEQHDRGHALSGLQDAIRRFTNRPSDRVEMIHFGPEDVQRHEVIRDVLHAYA
jgi:phosphate starvation-inducible PhoH-like protein